MEDADIVELYLERNEQAIQETEKTYGGFCYSISFNILRIREDAEECVNDSYLQAWNSIPPARPKNFKSWIGKVVRNLSINKWKYIHRIKRSSETTVLLDELDECMPINESVEDIIDRKEMTRLLNEWLAGLPSDDRIIFLKRYWFGNSVKDIAAERGEKPEKVSKRLYILRKKLHKIIEREVY